MSNNKIDCYFKKLCSQDSTSSPILETSSTVISEASKLSDDKTSILESSPTKVRKLDQDSNCLNIERDPGLPATAQSVIHVEHFFSYVTVIVNLVDSSSKHHDQLQIAQAIRIEELTSTNELKTRRGKNQVGTVQRPGHTRWGSHLRSLRSLLDLFDSILLTLSEIINDKTGSSPKAIANGAYDLMMSFEFVFILHFAIELLEMTDDLCGILQYKSQDILNAMDAVTNTKELIQKCRESGWDDLFDKVKIFARSVR
ncbi:hypothetical protein BUALT_Bualt04G0045100 [Buddleja alternifolia]|uniref:Uncharacterized protein n=1 Tax=Buddleja alternifolia TaxID=168488 RepID=A0AAV6XX65_9LAMI|nr:hypothetical protein BUALT_Bualt04G0045100 [Buddleja alternifolia]